MVTLSAVEAPKVVFLDQHVWVALARDRGPDAAVVPGSLESRLQNLVNADKLWLPLSAQNYLELWNRREDSSRADVASVMRDLSKYLTILALDKVQEIELSLGLGAWKAGHRPTSVFAPATSVFGRGANHAFNSETGRLRLVESIHTPTSPEGPSVRADKTLLALIGALPPREWEWLNLVGFDNLHDFVGMEVTPEHRKGDDYVAIQNEARRLVMRVGGRPGFSGERSLLLRYLAGAQLDDWGEEIVAAWGIPLLSRLFQSPEDGLDFVASIPTADVRMTLEHTGHRNLGYQFKQHDKGDIYSISQAMPYCDAIFPDKHWGQAARGAHLDRRYNTKVLRSVAEFSAYLDDLD